MTRHGAVEGLEVRPYQHDDEGAVLDLLSASLTRASGREWSAEYFRWKHLDNPLGRSLMLVAALDGRIIGLRAFLRWRFRSGNSLLEAVRAVDTATHPDYRGKGVFSLLTKEAIEAVRPRTAFIFNTPNDKSGPGYLKMGWKEVGTIRLSVRVRRPLSFVAGLRSLKDGASPADSWPRVDAETAAEALADPENVSALLEESRADDQRLRTPLDLAYLRWRYASSPGIEYKAVRHVEHGWLRGLAFFRVRPRGLLWETTLTDMIVAPEDYPTARRLLRATLQAASVDHVMCHFSSGSALASLIWRTGFLPAPGGIRFVVNCLQPKVQPDPTDLRSWSLTLGDVELF